MNGVGVAEPDAITVPEIELGEIALQVLLGAMLLDARGLHAGEDDGELLKREERKLRSRIAGFSAGNRLSRDDVHGRKA